MESSLSNLKLDLFAFYFPNLKEFQCLYENDLDCDMAERGRESSLDNRIDVPSHMWKDLDRLDCSVRMAYNLAFPCKVDIWEGVDIQSASELRFLYVVLRDIRPSVLDVRLDEQVHFKIVNQPFILPVSGIRHLRMSLRTSSYLDGIPDILVRLLLREVLVQSCTDNVV